MASQICTKPFRLLLAPLLLFPAMCTLWLIGAGVARAQDSAPEKTPPLSFRPVLIPDARKAEFVRGYTPIRKERFETLWSRLTRPTQGAQVESRITQARYQAELEGGAWVRGKAELEVDSLVDRTARVELGTLSLAVRNLKWRNVATTPIWGADAEGRLLAFVGKSGGLLEFDWALRGEETAVGETEYRFELPSSLGNVLELTTPAGVQLRCDAGIVSRQEIDTSAGDSPILWQIETGGQTSLSVYTRDDRQPRRRTMSLVQRSDYVLDRRGIQATINLHPRVRGGSLSTLELLADNSLVLIDVVYGATRVADSAIEIVQDGGQQRWKLELPQPLQGESEAIQLRVFARFERDVQWSLPQVRVEQPQWSSTLVSLEINQQLELQRYETSGSYHQAVSRSANGNLRLQFQHLQADGQVSLVVTERQQRARVESGLHLRLDKDRVQARLVADVTSDQGELFSFAVRRQDDWRIVSIVADPPEILRSDELNWEAESEFVVPLSRPATRDAKARIIIEAVRDFPDSQPRLSLRDARLATFVNAETERRLVRITGSGGSQAALSQDIDVFRIAPTELFDEEIERLGGSSGVLFEDDDRVSGALASLRPQSSSFDASIDIDVAVESQRLVETYRIRCTPDSLSLGEIQVQLSEGRDEDVVWGVVGATNELSAERSESNGDGPETWRLSLRRPTAAPIEIIGRRESGNSDRLFRASLADVLGAATQVSTITVRAEDATPLRLSPAAMAAAPPPVAAPGQYNLVRGVFRHEPPRRASLGVERLARKPACWVWRMLIESQLESTGVIGHRVLMQLENTGRSRMTIIVPDNTVDWLVYIDDEEVAAIKEANAVTIPLPPQRSRPSVSLQYRTHVEPTRWMGAASLTAPAPDMEVMRRDWKIMLPNGCAEWPESSESFAWRQRLFGGSVASLFELLQSETLQLQKTWQDERTRLVTAIGQAVIASQSSDVELIQHIGDQLRADDLQLYLESADELIPLLFQTREPHERDATPWEVGRSWLTANRLELTQRNGRWTLFVRVGGEDSGEASGEAQSSQLLDDALATLNLNGVGESSMLAAHRRLLRFRDVESVQVRYFHEQSFQAWEWCVLCVALAFGLRLASRSYSLAFLLATLLLLASLLVSPSWVVWTRGAANGVLIAYGLSHLSRRLRREEPPRPRGASESTRSLPNAAITSGSITLWLVLFYVATSQAQVPEGPVDQFGLPTDRPNVLIPVDGEQRPVGDYLYVPRDLYRRLIEVEGEADSALEGVLVTSARYILHADDPNTLGDLQAIFEIHVSRPGPVQLRLPPDRVRNVYWNGRPIEHHAAGERLEFGALQAGSNELEVVLAPGELKDGEYSLPIPVAGTAEVVLEGVDGLESVEFPTARGVVGQIAPDRWSAHLGASNQLQVRWRGLGQAEDLRDIEVEELYWLRVRPRSVSLDAQLILRPLRSNAKQFTLLVDPSLQLLNIGREQGIADHQMVSVNGDWVQHQFVLNEPIANERTVRLSFLWKGQAGLGRITAPRIRVDAKYVRDRRLAFSVAQPLRWDLTRDDRWEPLAPTEFAASWGDEGAPIAAFRAPREEVAWSLQTRYPPPHVSGRGELIVVVENDRLSCELIAEFDAQLPEQFQRRILAPKGFRLQSVSLTDAMRDRVMKARQDEDGSITLFNERPWSADERIAIRGSIDQNFKGSVSAPEFGLENGQLNVDTIRVYRRPDVSPLRFPRIEGYDREPLEQGEYTARYGRLEAVLKRSEGEPVVKIRSSQKRASVVDGVIVTTLTREDGQWLATANVGLDVRNKSPMDVIRFDIPAAWTDLELDSGWAFRVAPLPNPDRRQLIVYPDSPVEKTTLSIRGRLSVGAEERLRYAPEITPLDTRRLRRYLVLPTRLENQRYVWEISGPEESPPESLRPDLPGEAEYQSVLAVGRARASVQVASQPAGQVRIRTADYRVRWRDKQNGYGVAQFDVEPSGASFCLLSLPVDVSIMRLAVDDIEQVIRNDGAKNISIELGAEQLPHRVEVVFRVAGTEPRKTAPFLSDESNQPLPCGHTLWTVESPSNGSLETVFEPNEHESKTSLEVQRLDSLSELVKDVAGRDSAAPQQDLAVWFRAWSGRLAAMQLALQDVLDRDNAADEQVGSTIRDALARSAVIQDQANRRFGGGEGYVEFSGVGRAWEQTARSDLATSYMAFEGAQQASIPAIVEDVGEADHKQPLGASIAAALVAACAGLFLVRRRENREWFFTWPHTWLVALGILWWAFMPLAWLGLAFALVMMASSFDSSWRTARR